MKLIVISAPWSVQHEAPLINQLFEAGLESFHFRKPELDAAQARKLLLKIAPEFHQRIVLHQYHELAAELGVGGLHYPERERERFCSLSLAVREYRAQGLTLSTSIHDLGLLSALEDFDYVLYGPVSDSISKTGYQARELPDSGLVRRTIGPDVIAIGGMDSSNITRVKEMGFDGVAVLGHLWMDPLLAADRFKHLKALQDEFK